MKKLLLFLMAFAGCGMMLTAQPGPREGRSPAAPQGESWVVNVNPMDDNSQSRINQMVTTAQARGGATRGVMQDIAKGILSTGTTSMIDIVATEAIKLATLRKRQKQEWTRMITRENHYSDTIGNIKGMQDFYSEVSQVGALDPSNLNFDGITLRGMRNGKEVLFMSCHIDTSQLDRLIRYSKFVLVLDTLIFHPYDCHLPNLEANGIRLNPGQESDRDNSFSFNERQNLRVGIEITLSSSWINEAVMVMNDVELGSFSLSVPISPDRQEYIYSRRQIEANRRLHAGDTSFVTIDGDCFVVPRSYMTVSGGKRMWGTGEYKMQVVIHESCQFVSDEDQNVKARRWHRDYRQLTRLQRQHRGGYLRQVWQQSGNALVKQVMKESMTIGAKDAGLLSTGGNAGGGKGGAPASGNPQQGAPAK